MEPSDSDANLTLSEGEREGSLGGSECCEDSSTKPPLRGSLCLPKTLLPLCPLCSSGWLGADLWELGVAQTEEWVLQLFSYSLGHLLPFDGVTSENFLFSAAMVFFLHKVTLA